MGVGLIWSVSHFCPAHPGPGLGLVTVTGHKGEYTGAKRLRQEQPKWAPTKHFNHTDLGIGHARKSLEAVVSGCFEANPGIQ